jgi:hypothetical protein
LAEYKKYSQIVFQTFRFQLLWDGAEVWARARWNTGDYWENGLPGFDMEKFRKELDTTNPWHIIDAKRLPYIKKLMEDQEICTKATTMQIRPQRLFLHEERPDMLFSSLITLQSREPSKIWETYIERKRNAR